MHAQRAGQRRRAGQARAQREQHHQPHHDGRRELVEQGQQQQHGRAGQAQQIAVEHQPLQGPVAYQLAGQRIAHGHAAHEQAQVDGHLMLGGMQLLDEDEGRRRQEGIDGRGGAAAAHGKAHEGRRAQQAAVVVADGAQVQAARGLAGFGQQLPDGEGRHAADHGQRAEDGAPAQGVVDGRADGRRDAGADHHHQVEQRQAAHGVLGRARIARNGAAQGQARAAAQRLEQPRADQPGGGRGEKGRQAGQRIEDEPGQQHGAAPQAVRQRAIDQLAHAQAQDVDRDGQLHLAGAGLELACRIGQGGQEHVHGQRADDGHDHQQP